LAGEQFDAALRAAGLGGRAVGSGLRRVRRIATLLRAACLLDRFTQDELDLPVEAAQIVVRPALERSQQGRVDTKQEGLSLSHGTY
jgi:hypothetical protein